MRRRWVVERLAGQALLLGLGWVSSAPRWVSADDDGLTVGDAAAEDEEGAGDFKLPPDFNSESLMDDGILDELKRGAKDGSDLWVPKASPAEVTYCAFMLVTQAMEDDPEATFKRLRDIRE